MVSVAQGGDQATTPSMLALAGALLAMDASGAACSVALWSKGRIAARSHRPMTRGHAEALMPMVVATLADAQVTMRDLAAVAVTVGPGAFTGIRIGLAAARGIGLAAGISVVGITTFAAVAQAIPSAARADRRMVIVLDSKRGDVFVQTYDATSTPLAPPAIMSPQSAADLASTGRVVIAGDGVALVRPYLPARRDDIQVFGEGPVDAVHVAGLAARLPSLRHGLPPVPLYLRAPDVRLAVAAAEDRGAAARSS
jgi:tRNA threonylcarbamoyladenosine biosynthesis protein TsaB